MIDKEIIDLLYNEDSEIDIVLFSHRKIAIWHKGEMNKKRAYRIMELVVREYYRREMQLPEVNWNYSKRVVYYQFGYINSELMPDMEIAFIKSLV